MLALFRKYQKVLFTVVSIMVLASFAFFGVQKAGFDKQVREKDGDVGVAVDGSKIRLLELNRLKRFIRTDAHDTQMLMARDMPNMLNDGIIRNEFIKTGLLKDLFLAYKEELQPEFTERVAKQKRFKPYVNKEAPFLSVEGLWEHILPELKETFEAFKKIPADDYENNIQTLLTLYDYEQKFPPHMLKQFLHYQANQYKWVQPDSELANGTFALFRAKHIGDWFGEQSIDLIAQTILNGALVAKREGYTVSRKEAEDALYENGKQALAMQQGGKATEKEVRRFVENQLQYLQLSEFDAISLMQKIQLFKKYFQDVGSAVFVDTATLKTYQESMGKKVDKMVYHFVEPIALRSFRDMLGFQYYIDAITTPQARKSMHILDLPQAILPAEHVEKKTPELTRTTYTVKLRSVKKDDLLMEIPVQDVWKRQLEEKHFAVLQEKCSELRGKGYATELARQEKLDALDDVQRDKVDRITREELLQERPELLQELLSAAEEREEAISISIGNGDAPLVGISDFRAFRDMLETAEKPIEAYSQDGTHFYSLEVKEKGKGLELLSYCEAKEKGILDGLLTRFLEKQYPEIREKHPNTFKDAEGNWKPFAAVRDEIGGLVYQDLCTALDTFAKRSLTREEYPEVRFGYFFDKLYTKVKEDEGCLGEQEGQWKVEKEEVVSVQSEKGAWYDEDAFHMDPKSWSSSKNDSNGRPYIYRVGDVCADTGKLPELIEKERNALAKEAKRELMLELIAEMQKEDAIHFLYDKGE